MKKFIYFFKNSKNKFYLKLIEVLLEAEKPHLPKELKDNLENFFELFSELKLSEKIIVIIIFSLSTLYLFLLVFRVYSLIAK